MASLTGALAPSLASAFAPDSSWLTQNVTSPAGKGPVTTGPSEVVDDPVNGTAPVALNPPEIDWQESELTVQAPDYLATPADPNAGPWPALPDRFDGKEPFGQLPPDGIQTRGEYKIPPRVEGLVQHQALLPGHDAHAQLTDTAGWQQITPSGRTAKRQSWWQQYLGVDFFWPITQPNPARTRPARGGDQAVHGVVAQYGDLANSGGNQAYEPPAPPPVSTALPEAAAATIPQWGF